jgi:hypothetical protein
LLKAYRWLISSSSVISRKRGELSKIKKVSENEVLKYISGKLFSGENAFEEILNLISISYCKATGLRILENQKQVH